ncbi:neprilysin-1-like [Amblyomma americanum]
MAERNHTDAFAAALSTFPKATTRLQLATQVGETNAGRGATAVKRCVALCAASLCGFAILVWVCVRLAAETKASRCGTPECDRYAAILHNSSASAVGPCEDFYDYVCARWSGAQDSVQHVLRTEVQRDVFTRLLRMDVPTKNQRAWHKAAKLLQTCLDVAQRSQSPVEPLIRFMRHVGLLWPLPSHVIVLDLLVKMSLYWGIPVWGAFQVDSLNRDLRHRPLLVFGETVEFDQWLQRKHAMYHAVQYDQYLSAYLRAFGLPTNRTNDTILAIAAADALVDRRLIPLLGLLGDSIVTFAGLPGGVNLTDSLNRLAYWTKEKYTTGDIVRVHNLNLLYEILNLATLAPADVLSLSFGWSVARQLGQYVSRDLAMVQYFAFEAADESLRTDCFDFVWSFMTISMGTPYVAQKVTTELHEDITGLVKQLQDNLERIIFESSILSHDYKENASFILRSMKKVLFWPEGMRGERDVNRLFGDVPDLRMPVFLDNWVLTRAALRNVTVSIIPQVYRFPSLGAAPVYDVGNNALAVPVGATSFPMYSSELVPAANYGGLARTLTAAMAGALYWEHHPWLRGATLSLYRRRLDCLVSMFHTYQGPARVGAPGRYGAADGVDQSAVFVASWTLAPLHAAYRSAVAGSRRTVLSGARNLDAEQLFFVSFCLSQCSNEDSLDNRLLCNVPLRNFPSFASAFRCARDTYMNPQRRCLVW